MGKVACAAAAGHIGHAQSTKYKTNEMQKPKWHATRGAEHLAMAANANSFLEPLRCPLATTA
jgi:hypothetical protein